MKKFEDETLLDRAIWGWRNGMKKEIFILASSMLFFGVIFGITFGYIVIDTISRLLK
jgi:hypothetical protein